MLLSNKIYEELRNDRKGKVGIICNSKFTDIVDSPGYNVDRDRLTAAFRQIGFEVYLAMTVEAADENLTAKVHMQFDIPV